MKLTSQEKLAIMREMDKHPMSGIMRAIEFYNENMDKIGEEMKAKYEFLIAEFNRKKEKLDQQLIDVQLKTKDGEDGYTPVKGVDYFDGKDGRNGKDGRDGIDGIGITGISGKDGKDGSPDTPIEIATKLNTLDKAIEMHVIKGLDAELRAIRASIRSSRGTGRIGGGGDVVVAGSNVTITRTAGGKRMISSTGGSSGGGSLLPQDVSGLINGANVTYTIPTTFVGKSFIILGSSFMVEDLHYTVSGTTITYTSPPPFGSDGGIHVLYAGGGSVITNSVTSGNGAPSSTPAAVGDVYIDILNRNAYIAVGTSSSSDWELQVTV